MRLASIAALALWIPACSGKSTQAPAQTPAVETKPATPRVTITSCKKRCESDCGGGPSVQKPDRAGSLRHAGGYDDRIRERLGRGAGTSWAPTVAERRRSGYGTGRGMVGRRSRRGASVRIGDGTVSAGLDKRVIRRHIRRKRAKLLHCYEKRLLVSSSFEGTVVAELTIGETGAVTRSVATGMDATVATCVGKVLEEIAFPRPKGGAVKARWPIIFGWSGEPWEAPKLAELSFTTCQQATSSHLDPKLGALRSCYEAALRRSPGLTAQLQVRYGVDARQIIATSHVRGGKNAELRRCVAAAFGQGVELRPFAAVYECDVTFETTTSPFAPAGTVAHASNAALAIDGMKIPAPKARTVAELTADIEARRRDADTPLLLRIEPELDMQAVDLLLWIFGQIGHDRAYFYARKGAGWELVSATPVMIGSSDCDENPVDLSIRAGSIHLSRAGTSVAEDRHKGGADAAALATLLDKARARWPHLIELHIFVDNGQPYSVLVAALRAAKAKGFTAAHYR